MNDANQIRAEIDEFTPRVQFLINPNDGSLCLIRDLVSPGRWPRIVKTNIELQMRADRLSWFAMIHLILKGDLLNILTPRRDSAETVLVKRSGG